MYKGDEGEVLKGVHWDCDSTEDLGAENRALRAAAGIQSPTLGGGPAGVTSDIRTAES